MTTKPQFTAPTGDEPAGFHRYRRPQSPYERFMEEEGVPIIKGIGLYDTRQAELGNWKRLGGRGAFLHFEGVDGGGKGMFLLEIPARGAVNPEKHMYDEFFLVIEGRGSTEIWRDPSAGVRAGGGKKFSFEWQPGSLFMCPINSWHRHVNAGSSPALLLAANNAPPAINMYQTRSAIFENAYEFSDRYEITEDFFKAKEDLEMDVVRGRAALSSNYFPDIVSCELPLDNQRAPGYRRIQPYYSGFAREASTGGFIAQYPSGRYSKAHYHAAGAVLVCLRGKGYSYNWRTELGPHPWENGKGDDVRVQEYIAGGCVAAAPGGGNWFHQHFSSGSEPLRVINYWGGPSGKWTGLAEEGDEEEQKAGNIYGIHEGGRTILYYEEDPHIRNYYKEQLNKAGVEFDMPESVYQETAKPSEARPLVTQTR